MTLLNLVSRILQFPIQLPSAAVSKPVAKFNTKFKNHQNQLCRTVNIYDDIVMYKYSLKSFQHCVTLIYCLVKFIIYHQ